MSNEMRIKYLQTPNLGKTPLGEPNSGGLTDDVKSALLDCFENVAWINDDGQTFYDALEAVLYPPVDLLSISAVFNQGSAGIYDTDSLDALKPYLTVTATMSDSTTQTVTNYTLSGTLAVGTSTITVTYGGKTDTFTVVVTELNTTPVIEITGYMLHSSTGATVENSAWGITKRYAVPWVTGHVYKYLAANTNSGITAYAGAANFNADGTYNTTWGIQGGVIKTMTATYDRELLFECSLILADVDNSYFYNETTGEIIFAGANTPYYNKRNIYE